MEKGKGCFVCGGHAYDASLLLLLLLPSRLVPTVRSTTSPHHRRLQETTAKTRRTTTEWEEGETCREFLEGAPEAFPHPPPLHPPRKDDARPRKTKQTTSVKVRWRRMTPWIWWTPAKRSGVVWQPPPHHHPLVPPPPQDQDGDAVQAAVFVRRPPPPPPLLPLWWPLPGPAPLLRLLRV